MDFIADGKFAYWMDFSYKLYKIDCESLQIVDSYLPHLTGPGVVNFKILTQQFAITLNVARNQFTLINLEKSEKIAGVKIGCKFKSCKVLDFDCSFRGSRLFVLVEEKISLVDTHPDFDSAFLPEQIHQ